jgi:DinB family protein
VAPTRSAVDVYVEAGSRRVFAGAVEWPGWCRSGRDGVAALEALIAYGPRYKRVVGRTRLGFRAPAATRALEVVERLEGDATTDFGAPSVAPHADACPLDLRELARLRKLLEACWVAFDGVVQAAEGAELRKGPRGGGRDLEAIVGHVVAAEASYVRKLAARPPNVDEDDARAATAEVRGVALDALSRAVTEGMPEKGPRGGSLWVPRYFVRRVAWHVLDHAWEIEDRSEPSVARR